MAEKIEQVDLIEQHNRDMTEYAIYIARKRVIPDYRDGLKSIHRRIIYAMYNDLHNTPDKNRSKTAKIVGQVMGSYHPHGNTAIADAMKPMSNWFECKVPYLDGLGNWGNPFGAPASAMRYTESRLSQYSMECILSEMKDAYNSCDWEPNYSEETQEPIYLPAAIPNLLINGAYGIAAGLAVDIPKHNLIEVVDATIALIHNPNIDIVLYPDNCMETEIIDTDWKSICNTGRGTYKVRAKVEISTYENYPALKITSVPDLVYFDNIQKDIESMVEKNKLPQVHKIVNLTEPDSEAKKEPITIFIVLKKDVDPNYVRDYLYATTSLENGRGVNFEVLINDAPKLVSYKEYLLDFIAFRKLTKFRLYCNRLKDAKTKFHKMELYIRALESGEINNIIKMIQKQKGTDETQYMEYLIKKLNVTDAQARFLLSTDIKKLSIGYLNYYKNKRDEYMTEINKCFNVLTDDTKIVEEIIAELEYFKQKYGAPRMSKLISKESAKNIPQGTFQIVITKNNKIRKYEVGANITGLGQDYPISVFNADNTDSVLIFGNMGRVFKIPIAIIPFQLMDIRKISKNLTSDITSIILESNLKIFAKSKKNQIYTLTKNSFIKRMSCADFINVPLSGMVYAKLEDGDSIVDVIFSNINNDIVIYAENKALRISGMEPPQLMRSTKGNTAMNSRGDMLGFDPIYPEATGIISITKNGYINHVNISALPLSKRAKSGNTMIKVGKNDKVIKMSICKLTDKLKITNLSGTNIIDISSIPFTASSGSGKRFFKDILTAEIIK